MPHEQTTRQLIEHGREALNQGSIPQALEQLTIAAEREPGFADVQNMLGTCRSLMGDWEGALTAFDRAVRENPGYVEAHLNRAITLNEIGRYEQAQEAFEQAASAAHQAGVGRFPIAIANRLANLHRDIGDIYAEAGAREDAVREYRLAKEVRPQFVDIRNKLARTLIDLDEPEKAIEELEEILSINPGYVAARANLGLALFHQGELEDAQRTWEQCLRQKPDNPQVKSYLRMVRDQRGSSAAEDG